MAGENKMKKKGTVHLREYEMVYIALRISLHPKNIGKDNKFEVTALPKCTQVGTPIGNISALKGPL